MDRFFNQDSPLYRFLNRLGDLILLNLLFIVTSIPLVTIGASLSALYTVTLKGVRKEDSYIVRSYFAAFKENFKKATCLWLLLAAVWLVLGIDVFVIAKRNGPLVFMGGVFGVIWLLITIYAFALQARFENSVRNTILNSLVAGVKFLPYTIQILGILVFSPILMVLLAVFSPTLLGWFCSLFLFIGFSGVAWCSSFLYRKVFDRLMEFDQSAQQQG